MQIHPIPLRASPSGAVAMGLFFSATGLAIAANLMPGELTFTRCAEMAAVILSGVFAGVFIPMAVRVMLDGPSGVLLTGPIIAVVIGASIASGSLVLPWSNPATLAALALSWIAAAASIGRAVWMTTRPMPMPPHLDRQRDDGGGNGSRGGGPRPHHPIPGCPPCEDARNSQQAERIASEPIAKAMSKETAGSDRSAF